MSRTKLPKLSRLSLVLAHAVWSSALHAQSSPGVERISLGPTALKLSAFEQRAERGILTPVPIEITLPAQLKAARVLVHYRIHGSDAWSALELRRSGPRWWGAIPCLEVSTITGDIRFYLRVHDARGGVIAFSGSRHQPYRIAIMHQPQEQASGAGRCPDPSDCPPGLPGCPSPKVDKIPCSSDRDCEGGLSCGWEGYCELDDRAHNWLSAAAEYGVGVVALAGACSVESQESSGYLCTREGDGVTYTGNPVYTNEPLAVGAVPLRFSVGYERLLDYRHSVAVRFGYAVLGSGPTARGGAAFVPYAAEMRGTHFFSADPFARAGLHPYVFLGAGYAMYDIRVRTRVREDPFAASSQGGNDLEQNLEVWKRAGDAFIDLGLGGLLLTSKRVGILGELKAAQVFPFGALVMTAQLGVQAGF
ncbi:MAG TPA: hypothetical protein VFQ61_08640 [Polyangiaceae bacterium]|nr:hypothetical protein [Polyangiaceae bacterium]